MEAAGFPGADPALLEAAAPLVQERVNYLTEVPGMVGFLLSDEVELDPAAAAKVLTDAGRAFLAESAKRLEEVEPWTAAGIEETLRGLQTERDLKPRTAFQPVRLAITGRLVSPPLFESMELLGKPRSWPAWTGPPPCLVERSAHRPLRCPSPWANGPRSLGCGVIGSPTGSGPVSLGSSPGTPARRRPTVSPLVMRARERSR